MTEAEELARKDAEAAAVALYEAAEEVDRLFLESGEAYDRLLLAALDVSRHARRLGAGDAGRLMNGMGPGLRWSIGNFCPDLAEALQVPRVTAARRRPLSETVATMLPDLSAGGTGT